MLIYWENTNNLQTKKTKEEIIEIQAKHAFKFHDEIHFL